MEVCESCLFWAKVPETETTICINKSSIFHLEERENKNSCKKYEEIDVEC